MESGIEAKALESVVLKMEGSKDKEGYTFLEHLAAMIEKIQHNQEEHTLDKIEELSYLIKLTRFRMKQPLLDSEIRELHLARSEMMEWADLFLTKLRGKCLVPQLGFVPDIMAEANMFEWAGVGFSTEEWFLIHKSIKMLAQQSVCSRVRFWGKLLCSQKNLYVVEMRAKPDESLAPVPGEEQRGEGINEYIYWVTEDLLGEWRKLPDLKGEQVVAAKKIKKMLTGDLEASVEAYPFFPWKEAFLIRAQIARITASTVLAPKGIFRESEANPRDIEVAEDGVLPGLAEAKSQESWVHLFPAILSTGRSKHILPSGTPNPEEEMERLSQADPVIPRLRGINEDEKFGSYATAWQVRSYGDEQTYAKAPPKEGTTSYSVVVLRPYKWPGAITAFANGLYQSLYIGTGIPLGGDSFCPVSPADVQVDPEDLDEQPEPNPKDALEVLESDTDEEKKEDKQEDDQIMG